MAHSIEQEIHISRPIESPARELTLNIFRTEQYLTERLQEVLQPADLRLDEYNVLRILRGAGDAGHQRTEIERRMVHDPERLLALLHKLKSRGFIQGSLRLTNWAEFSADVRRLGITHVMAPRTLAPHLLG